MTFVEELQIFAEGAVVRAKDIKNEAGTSISLVLPFLELLHYDTRNPLEVCPEYGAGVKAANDNKRVDFAVLHGASPIILVEVKAVDKRLDDEKYTAQLFQYFAASEAGFAIFTNGIVYRFYTDTKLANIMDDDFFLEIDLEDLDVRAADVLELFKKEVFDANTAKGKIAEYNSARQVREYISRQLSTFDDDFVRFFIKDTEIYSSHKNDMQTYREIVKRAFADCISEYSAIQSVAPTASEQISSADGTREICIQIVMSAIRDMFGKGIRSEKLTHWFTKNGATVAYFGIIVCRLFFYDDGELYKMLFLTSDDTYPRKNKNFFKVDRNTDFTQFKGEFGEQIEQVKHWVKGANI